MRMLMPSHAKVVQPYKEITPLFTRFGVEAQLDAMFSNVVTLKSGGYIVINQTEALVSIDVNSGRSTREHNIEDTALSTNLEAAEEISRQLRLRDLAGLVVIDFIDMEENRNNRAVERKLNDCLKHDRARIQVGRISHFGLLEMSRQRIRTGVLESSTTPCPHCSGTGLLRSTTSLALLELRALEEALIKNASLDIILRTRMETAFYLLNQKRESLRALEARFGVTISVMADSSLAPAQHYLIERGEQATPRFVAIAIPADGAELPRPAAGNGAVHPEDVLLDDEIEETIEDETTEDAGENESETRDENGDVRKRRRRRRRRGRGGNGEAREAGDGMPAAEGAEPRANAGAAEDEDGNEPAGEDASGDDQGSELSTEEKRRRRRRRGGRRNRRDRDGRDPALAGDGIEAPADMTEAASEAGSPEPMPGETEDQAPAKPRRGRGRKPAETVTEAENSEGSAPMAAPVIAEEPADDAVSAKPRRGRGRKAAVEAEAATAEIAPAQPEVAAAKPRRARGKKSDEIAMPTEAHVAEAPVAEAAIEAPVMPAPVIEAPAPAPEVKAAPEPEVEEVVDPNRPKRTGWWAKAKQALGG
jgi:ribonuclease E